MANPRIRGRTIDDIEGQRTYPIVGNGPVNKRMRTSGRSETFGGRIQNVSMEDIKRDTMSGDPPLTAPFSVSGFEDRKGYTVAIQKGEFLFALHAHRSADTQNCVHVFTLTRLNEMLVHAHEHAKANLKGNLIKGLLPVTQSLPQPDQRDPSLDILQRVLPDVPMTVASFLKRVTYLGPVITPGTLAVTYANMAGAEAKLRAFMIEKRGMVETANIWGAVDGEDVGFVVRRFHDHTKFRDVDNNNVLARIGPLQVYPCILDQRKSLTIGRRLARSTLIDELQISRADRRDGVMAPRWFQEPHRTSAERSIAWDEVSPRTVDRGFMDYKVEAITLPGGARQLVGHPMPFDGHVIRVGSMKKHEGGIPSADLINLAILGTPGAGDVPMTSGEGAWGAFISLLHNHRCYVHVQSNHPHTYTPDGRPF